MTDPRHPSPRREAAQRPQTRASAEASAVRLGRRFATFRRQHPDKTRIPDTLRGAVLAAVRQGVRLGQIKRCCGVTSQQIELWQRGRVVLAREPTLARPAARVFDVVSDREVSTTGPGGDGPGPHLELCVDGWWICIRRAGPQEGRGNQACYR
jgi:hypothetical protein